jgi:hypothetical protein
MAAQAGDPERAHRCGPAPAGRSLYSYSDPDLFAQGMPSAVLSMVAAQSLDHLLQRDLQREKDGFPRKIRVGKLVKPGRDGDDKVVVIPTTVEEKLIHDPPEEEEAKATKVRTPAKAGPARAKRVRSSVSSRCTNSRAAAAAGRSGPRRHP